MSKLLNRSEALLDGAATYYRNSYVDNAYIDLTCFNLAQCIALSLKDVVFTSGQVCSEEQGFVSMLDMIYEHVSKDEIFDRVRNKVDLYTSWKDEALHNVDFEAVASDIDEAFELCRELTRFVNILITSKEYKDKLSEAVTD